MEKPIKKSRKDQVLEESIDKRVSEESIKKKVIGGSIKKSRKSIEIEESYSDFRNIKVVLFFSVLLCINLPFSPRPSECAGTNEFWSDFLFLGFCTFVFIYLVLMYQIPIL